LPEVSDSEIMAFSLAFLQARMGSTRLPGKVLMRLNHKSILERAVDRLRAARMLDGIVVLTTELDEDIEVVREACRLGAGIFRGPELDVLSRFRMAADLFRPEIIVRATADNPLIDIGSVDRIIRRLNSGNLEYCMEQNLPMGAATEAITRAALARVDRLARLPHHREHVTIYIKENPCDFRAAFPNAPKTLRMPDLRITVDTPADFLFVESLIQSLPETGSPIPLSRYLSLGMQMRRKEGSAQARSPVPRVR